MFHSVLPTSLLSDLEKSLKILPACGLCFPEVGDHESAGCLQDPELNIPIPLSSRYPHTLPAQQQQGQAPSTPPSLSAPVS